MIDEGMRPYATDRQWQVIEAIAAHGGSAGAARALGITKQAAAGAAAAVAAKAARAGYSPAHDMTRTVPDGFLVKGVSTYYGADGEPRGQWVKSHIDADRQRELFEEACRAFADTLPRVEPEPFSAPVTADLMACYPMGDPHFGMRSWGEETGGNYDLEIAERLHCGAIDHLVDASPACERAAVISLGDFFHTDGFDAVTPTSKHLLDADSRYPKMVRVGIRSMRYAISRALQKHHAVDVIVEIGNHDISSSVFMAECLANIYENEPRVRVDTSPSRFHLIEFGRNLVGIHHGDGISKAGDLVMLMAELWPEAWGRTEHRTWWLGHVHHKTVDQPKSSTCTVETFGVIPPPDGWAAGKGLRSRRYMSMIVLHRTDGEVSRTTVTPQMIEAQYGRP